jgi:hypothetical protein
MEVNHMKNCSHPKRKVASYTDPKNNVYIERCIACTKKIVIRKFPKVVK